MNDNRDQLPPLLKSWRHDPAPAPDFADAVWKRIRAAEVTAPHASFFHFPAALPLAASFAVLLAGLAGTSAALAVNHAQAEDRMATAYVRTIDPLQMTASATTSTHSHP